jgi:hypothetical protein
VESLGQDSFALLTVGLQYGGISGIEFAKLYAGDPKAEVRGTSKTAQASRVF